MSIKPNTRAQILVKILRGHVSVSDKTLVIKQCGDVFHFARITEPVDDDSWEAFRDAEVLDSLLEISSTLDLIDVAAITLLEAVLRHLRTVFLNPITTTMICSHPRMNAILLKYMPQIIASTYDALQTSNIPEDAQSASIRESALTIVGALLMSSTFKEDETFLKSLDKDYVLQILFETYIISKPMPEAIPLKYGTAILSSYFKDGNFDNEAIERVLEHHTAEKIAQRSLDLFKIDLLSMDSMLSGALHFLLSVNHSPKMHRPLVEAGVHLSMIQRYWRWIASKRRSEEEMCSFARAMATATNSFLRALEGDEHIELKNRVISQMVRQAEFMFVLGRTLLSKISFESASNDVLYIGRCIAEAVSGDTDFMNEEMKLAYMHCFRCLEDFIYSAPHKQDDQKGRSFLYESDKDQPDFTPAIQGWKEFGKLLGFDREQIQAEEFEKRKKEIDGVEGCSWFKCCLYRDTKIAPLREMMRCSGCKSVQYCGTRCQKLDWKEGGHKEECKSKSHARSRRVDQS
ncbi:hypothetical protein M407DRAFT_18796 [Tulasnella calospora MUT 4182]|uniref:MYND-type domain-containing protein n=1 Tax=Tulasnella calospora MUT 4182 TaxID=1051891 RepID=A0A0C3QT11_9AGAM|nr:hypothetical protein M407DRAFT_18796 [Tulasnella calospora MUT 4182]